MTVHENVSSIVQILFSNCFVVLMCRTLSFYVPNKENAHIIDVSSTWNYNTLYLPEQLYSNQPPPV